MKEELSKKDQSSAVYITRNGRTLRVDLLVRPGLENGGVL